MKNNVSKILRIQQPVLQGPFGGGLSSANLVSKVSNWGGLGGYGAYHLQPEEIEHVITEIRQLTSKPFNINLWVNDVDEEGKHYSKEEFDKVAALFKPFFDELTIPLPQLPQNARSKFEKQAEVLLRLKVPVFSFVFGIPDSSILKECKRLDIKTIGTATTVDEAIALEEADVDMVVASGFEAGGHRPSFLRPAEDSLHGTFSLLQQLTVKVKKPIIAAGGIGDPKGISAAMELGASGVQIGTAFLACEESGASNEYRAILFSDRAKYTSLTKVFTGRLARGITGTLAEELKAAVNTFPLPLQTNFMSSLHKAALEQGRSEMLTFWAGQNASLLKHRNVDSLMKELCTHFVMEAI